MSHQKPVTVCHMTTVALSLFFVKGLIEYLKTKDIRSYAVTSPGELADQFAEEHQIPVLTTDMPRRITPLRDLRAILPIWRILRQVRPDIVHSHTPKAGLLGTVAAWLGRTPVRIYHIHGLPYLTARGYRRFLLLWSERVSCFLADQVLCVSASIRQIAVDDGLCPPNKVKVLLKGTIDGIDAENEFNPHLIAPDKRQEIYAEYGIPPDARIIGFVGRIVRDKGIVELMTAWTRLQDDFPDLHLLLVGALESQDPIPPVVEKQLREDTRIHITGWITKGVSSFYSVMQIGLLPTYREGFPLSPMEAAAMEIPVVATRVPGCTDAVQDGITGTLIPPYDPEALEAAIRRYLNDPALARQHGKAGRQRVLRDFKPESMWEAVYQEYVRLLNARGISVSDR